MISLTEAVGIILANRPALTVMSVALDKALGQICAADVTANLTQPPFSASAMDGYAVEFGGGIAVLEEFEIIGDSPAGSPFKGTVKAGQAVRIFTGSVIPEGADHVIIQEELQRDGNKIIVMETQPVARNIRDAGIDFAQGDVLIPANTKISPAHIALAAAGNHAKINIFKPLTVALLAGGDELIAPGGKLGPGQIVSSNQAGLLALLKSWGITVTDLGIAKDDPADIAARVKACKADIIVPIGGASVGDHDHMRQVFHDLGFTLSFEKVAVRPGKPTWFAQKKGPKHKDQYALGLPGNPASAYVCANLFLPLLLGLSNEIRTIALPVTEDIRANGPRDHFQRSQIICQKKGEKNQLLVTPFQATDSSLITPLAKSNALIHLPADSGPWKAGENIRVFQMLSGPPIL